MSNLKSSTIRDRLIERLDRRIKMLRIVQLRLTLLFNVTDGKLDDRLLKLTKIRNGLQEQASKRNDDIEPKN